MKEQKVDSFYEEDACKEIREQIQKGWFVVSMCLHKIGLDLMFSSYLREKLSNRKGILKGNFLLS